MIKQLKRILVNIARLPSIDQHWILQQLTNAQLVSLKKWHGLKFLNEAQRFRALDACDLTIEDAKPLPIFCPHLATKPPLFAAIIIEQGSYPWVDLFLEKFDTHGAIKTSLEQVPNIKPHVKTALFNEWEQSLTFESHLDTNHG